MSILGFEPTNVCSPATVTPVLTTRPRNGKAKLYKLIEIGQFALLKKRGRATIVCKKTKASSFSVSAGLQLHLNDKKVSS